MPSTAGPLKGGRSLALTVFVLLGVALAIRLGVVVTATVAGPEDSVNDVVYHSQLIDDPVGHLRHSSPEVAQYAPYLGFAEWMTARPWIAFGADDTTALRLGSVVWDLVGMTVLLVVVARRMPAGVVFLGLLWAASPLLWPASAFAAQDEPIAAAIVAGAVALAIMRRRTAALALLVVGLFVAKVLLVPVILAFLLTAPRASRARDWATTAATLVAAVAITWLLSGTDGLSQQLSYDTNNLGFSMTPWSTLVLHHVVEPETALHISIAVTCVALVGVVFAWSRHRNDRDRGATRLAASLLFVTFALLAVSNPEYLCIAAPVAIVACLSIDRSRVPWGLLVAAALAWAVNVAYYLLRMAYDPTGSLLGLTGFRGSVKGRVAFLDAVHQGLLIALWLTLIATAWYWLMAEAAVPEDSEEAEALPGWWASRPRGRSFASLPARTRSLQPGATDARVRELSTKRTEARANKRFTLVVAAIFVLAGVAATLVHSLAAALICWGLGVVYFVGAFFIERDL